MTALHKWPVALIVGAFCFVAGLETGRDVAAAQARKAVYITRMFSGPDGQTHTEQDLTGKGHITRAVGAEDRITLWLPLADQPAKK